MNHSRAFYLLVNGKPHGPFPIDKLRQQVASGVLRPGTQVSNDGFTWRPVETVMAEPGPITSLSERPAQTAHTPSVYSWPALPRPSATSPHQTNVVSDHGNEQPLPVPKGKSHIASLLAAGSLCFILFAILAGLIVYRQLSSAETVVAVANNEEPAPEKPERPEKPVPDGPIDGVPVLEPPPKVKQPVGLTNQVLFAKHAPSVALVKFEDNYSSGFLLDSDLIATSAQVVGNRENVKVLVSFPSAEPAKMGPINGNVVLVDKDRGLALIHVKSELPFIKIGDPDQLNKDSSVIVIGNRGVAGGPDALKNITLKCSFIGKAKEKGTTEFLKLSLATTLYNLGAPLFNDQGEVVGMVTAKGVKVEGVALCVPANDLKSAIQDLK